MSGIGGSPAAASGLAAVLSVPGHGETADLLGQPLIPTLWAGRQSVRIHALREEAENSAALGTGKFVNGHVFVMPLNGKRHL